MMLIFITLFYNIWKIITNIWIFCIKVDNISTWHKT